MNLYLIDKPECHHMTELMPGISSVYQLQSEFEPYLKVHFVPNKDPVHKRKPGIIFQAGDDVIKRDYTFDSPDDIVKMRDIIWTYLKKMYNPGDITKGDLPKFKVIQGWANKKRQREENKSKMCIFDCNESRRTKDPDSKKVLNKVLKYESTRVKNREECKRAHSQECTDNYPSGSDNFARCMKEINYLCDGAFPENKIPYTNSKDDITKKYLLQYLEKNDFKADKQHMDLIHKLGLFDSMFSRAGNQYTPTCTSSDSERLNMSNKDIYRNILTEGYKNKSGCVSNRQLIFLLIVVAIILCTFVKKK